MSRVHLEKQLFDLKESPCFLEYCVSEPSITAGVKLPSSGTVLLQ